VAHPADKAVLAVQTQVETMAEIMAGVLVKVATPALVLSA